MKSPLDMGFPQQFLIALTIVTVGMLVVATGTSTSAFGSHNSGWDGASELRSKASDTGAKVDLVRDTSSYTSVNQKETVAVILSPKEPYSPTDKSRVKAFVRDGGTVVVAEDFGSYSNGLLGAIGARTRVDGRLIRDKRQYYQSPALPIVRTTSSDSYLGANERLTFNYGTALRPNGATVLAKTSKYSYFDSNNNQTLDSNETLGSRPVATTERIGDGRVIVISDPSLFVNAMLDRSGNEAFVEEIFNGHRNVLLDYSHRKELPLLVVAILTLKSSPLLQGLVGIIGITGSVLWMRRPMFLKRLSSSRPHPLVTKFQP